MNEAVKQIEQEVLTTWPAEAISHAENVVYRLSGKVHIQQNIMKIMGTVKAVPVGILRG